MKMRWKPLRGETFEDSVTKLSVQIVEVLQEGKGQLVKVIRDGKLIALPKDQLDLPIIETKDYEKLSK